MKKAYLSLGTNLANRFELMQAMESRLSEVLSPPISVSRLMETEPIGVDDTHEWYYNRLLCGHYNGSATELLSKCLAIEKALGRTEKHTKQPRTADIDILLIGQCIIEQRDLLIPHRELLNRRFCLEGMREIGSNVVHPIVQKTFAELYSNMRIGVRNQKIYFMVPSF